jgi:hypothetical protein
MMNWKNSKVLGTLALASALLAASGTRAAAQSSSSSQGLVGAWLVQVVLRNCETSAPIGSLHSLVSFHRGGTLSESPGAGFAPGQRSVGHGSWGHQGANTYSQEVIALITFDTPPNLPGTLTFDPTQPVSPGFLAGWQTITHTIELNGNELVSSGTNAFYRSDGTLYRTGCSTAVAQRFE